MPVVFRLGKLTFFFYSNEGNPREPMHIHVRGPETEAKIWITPAVEIADSKGFNRRELAVILGHVAKHKADIERAWHEHFSN
jgi:Domain of unknown function (DUF4160)